MWRVLYPVGIHFLAAQLVAYAALWIVCGVMGYGTEFFLAQSVLYTGITDLVVIVPCLYFYKKDRFARVQSGMVSVWNPRHGSGASDGKYEQATHETAKRSSAGWNGRIGGTERIGGTDRIGATERTERTGFRPGQLTLGSGVLLLVMGAAFSQFTNFLVALLQNYLHYEQYQETMDQITAGKSLLFLIVCMGLLAPIAEEMVFRWLIYLRLRDSFRMGTAMVLSGLIFGIYHGNLVQAFYAGILGMVFAYFLELSGNLLSSILLHIGANVWSLTFSEFAPTLLEKNPGSILLIYAFFLAALIGGTRYFQRRADQRNRKRLL